MSFNFATIFIKLFFNTYSIIEKITVSYKKFKDRLTLQKKTITRI